MIRLTFKKNEDGTLSNKHPLLAGRSNARISLDPVKMTYEVWNTDTDILMSNGFEADLTALKARVKKDLVALGVVFDDEIRRKEKHLQQANNNLSHDTTNSVED